MPGSGAAAPVSICDIAVPLRLHSNAVDRIAIAEGATKLDDDLMIISDPNPGRTFRPDAYTVPHIFNWPQFPSVDLSKKVSADDPPSTDSSLEAVALSASVNEDRK
jgi:hypothetical protein